MDTLAAREGAGHASRILVVMGGWAHIHTTIIQQVVAMLASRTQLLPLTTLALLQASPTHKLLGIVANRAQLDAMAIKQ